MKYDKPEDVKSPKSHWRLQRVLHDGGEFEWSAAEGQWWAEGEGLWVERLAIRWNGGGSAKRGNPQSRGYATWFIVPPELEDAVRKAIAS